MSFFNPGRFAMIAHRPLPFTLTPLALALLLGGCNTTPHMVLPAPLDVPEKTADADAADASDGRSGERLALVRSATPRLDDLGPDAAGVESEDELPALGSAPVSINVQNLPVPAFANEVFGNLLHLNLNMSPQVAALQDMVTLRTENRQTPAQMFALARRVLAEYGVEVMVEGELVRLGLASSGNVSVPPLIISGRTLPQVPVSHRPVFQMIDLEVVRSGDASRWLGTLFGQDIKVVDDSQRNMIVISGKPSQIRQAVEALRMFDRPLMRGRISTRLEPAFMNANDLSKHLVEVLTAQGYGAVSTLGMPASVIVLPIASANSVLIFANTQQVLDHAVAWARELDRPSPQAGDQSLFYYQVKNTNAMELAAVFGGSAVPRSTAASSTESRTPAQAANTSANAASGARSGGGLSIGNLQVDEARNALIYQGDPAQWERMLTLIRQMDRAPRQVMIEVTIAEITLSNSMDSGIDWFTNQGIGRFNGQMWSGGGAGGASGGGSGGPGLTWLLDVAGQTRATLSAMAQDNRVNILSNPRLMVKSGGDASMNVGDEIPTVSMTTTGGNQTNGTTNLLQSIQYRRTGVVLQIKPTVYSGNRVDLEITQEVSQASNDSPAAGTAAGAASPTIRNRSLTTSLTLTDGQTIVMGGLVSNNSTDSDTGIPLLKNIPLLGHLFKSSRKVNERQELVLIIVPYIVEDSDQIGALSQAVIDRFENIDLEQISHTLRPTLPEASLETESHD